MRKKMTTQIDNTNNTPIIPSQIALDSRLYSLVAVIKAIDVMDPAIKNRIDIREEKNSILIHYTLPTNVLNVPELKNRTIMIMAEEGIMP